MLVVVQTIMRIAALGILVLLSFALHYWMPTVHLVAAWPLFLAMWLALAFAGALTLASWFINNKPRKDVNLGRRSPAREEATQAQVQPQAQKR